METYNVDIYLAGEVHATTVSKRTNSNLLQVVSRGNRFNNFLGFTVTDDSIEIKAFNEVGSNPQNVNNTYTQFGELLLDKSNEETKIEATGVLELLSIDRALIRFDFERIFPFNSRQVIGLCDKHKLYLSEKKIRGALSNQSMHNKGSLGREYLSKFTTVVTFLTINLHFSS
jgi:hypothetical protein